MGMGSAIGANARTLWAVSDLHAAIGKNRDVVEKFLNPPNPQDLLIVAGDVAEKPSDVLDVLAALNQRYSTVIWAPGNHELFSRKSERLHGKAKYEYLVDGCRSLGILTPEDPYPRFAGHTVAPLFTLYDHSWRQADLTASEALDEARARGIVLTDDFAIAPFEDIPTWCHERLEYSVKRLGATCGSVVLINHWPLHRHCMSRVLIPELGLWSGSIHTHDWPQRFNADCVIYGHLHVPGEMNINGIRHVEVSLGYPREWENDRYSPSLQSRHSRNQWPYPVLVEEE